LFNEHATVMIWAEAPGNVLLPSHATGLPRRWVADSSQIITIDRGLLTECVGRLSPKYLSRVLSGIDVILDR